MLSNKEKEIIHICYDLFTNKVYARSGPSWLKKDDIKEMQSFIDCLKIYDEELNIMQNDVQQYYHLSCPKCGNTWWMDEAFPKYCPCCGIYRIQNPKKKKLNINMQIEKKDCTNCKHGSYNDHFDTYFCNNDIWSDCKEWSLWEAKN